MTKVHHSRPLLESLRDMEEGFGAGVTLSWGREERGRESLGG